jgi:hypothetical protein
MRIIFICGSLEEGCDGVGDHIRRLAGELRQLGHDVAAIALNDRTLSEDFDGVQMSGEIELPVLRISSKRNNVLRVKQAGMYIRAFQPAWISLHFVPYSFHDKGLPFQLVHLLPRLYKNVRWHVMFHETWIGVKIPFNLKNRVVAWLQKMLVKKMLGLLKPALINVTIPFNCKRISALGYSVKPRPLFSNIPVHPFVLRSYKDVFRIGVFSQVDEEGTLHHFLDNLLHTLTSSNMKAELLLIGGNPARMRAFGKKIERRNGLDLKVNYTGFVSEADLSHAIHSCTIGLTPIPRHALGKSGTVAAFIAHNKPVAAPNVDRGEHADAPGFFNRMLAESIITSAEEAEIQRATSSVALARELIALPNIAGDFIQDFIQAL